MIDETVAEIEEMQTHSSSVVAVKAAHALRSLADREFPAVEEFHRAIERNSSALRRANPSHASLHTTQRDIVEQVTEGDHADVAAAQDALRSAVDAVVERVETAKERAAERCAEWLPEEGTLLTHDYSSTVLSALEQAVADGASFDVYVTEARPRYLGRRTCRALADLDGVSTTLVVDSASGHVLPDCDRVLVGMDCIVEDVLYNRVGTYPIAATAAHAGVPVTAVGGAAKLIDGGFAFENEYRGSAEVMREPAEGFAVDNPAYDATPVELLDTVVTDEGVREY